MRRVQGGQDGDWLVLLNVERSRVNAVAEALACMEGVSEVYSVAGRYDLMVIILARDNNQMAELVTDHMLKVEGIIKRDTLRFPRSLEP